MDSQLKKNNKSLDKDSLVKQKPKNNNKINNNSNNNISNKFNNKINQDGEILLKNNNNNRDQQKPAINDLLFKYFFKLDKEASSRGFTEYGGSDSEKESNESRFIMGSPVLIKKNKKIQKTEIY